MYYWKKFLSPCFSFSTLKSEKLSYNIEYPLARIQSWNNFEGPRYESGEKNQLQGRKIVSPKDLG